MIVFGIAVLSEHRRIDTVWFSVESLIASSHFLQLSLYLVHSLSYTHAHTLSTTCQREVWVKWNSEYLSHASLNFNLSDCDVELGGTLSRLSAALLRFHERTFVQSLKNVAKRKQQNRKWIIIVYHLTMSLLLLLTSSSIAIK